MPASPTAPNPSARSPIPGAGKPYAGKREGPPPRRDRRFGDAVRGDDGERSFKPRDDRAGGGEKRPYTPRGDRPNFTSRRRREAPLHPARRSGDRGDARPAARFSDRKFGDKKPYTPREGGGEKRPYTPRGDRPQGDRPYSARPSRDGDRPRGDRPERKFGGDKKFLRAARRIAARARISAAGPQQRSGRSRCGSRRFKAVAEARCVFARSCRPQFAPAARRRAQFRQAALRQAASIAAADASVRDSRARARIVRKATVRVSIARARTVRRESTVRVRSSARRPQRLAGASAQRGIGDERPRRDNEDDSKVFAKRPAFGGRGEYRERKPEFEKRAARPPREEEIRRAHRQGDVARRACLAPRRRGMDRAGPRHASTAASSIRRRSTSPRTTSSPSTASRCRRASARGCSCFTSRAA